MLRITESLYDDSNEKNEGTWWVEKSDQRVRNDNGSTPSGEDGDSLIDAQRRGYQRRCDLSTTPCWFQGRDVGHTRVSVVKLPSWWQYL